MDLLSIVLVFGHLFMLGSANLIRHMESADYPPCPTTRCPRIPLERVSIVLLIIYSQKTLLHLYTKLQQLSINDILAHEMDIS